MDWNIALPIITAVASPLLIELIKWIAAKEKKETDLYALVLQDRKDALAEARAEIRELKAELKALEDEHDRDADHERTT